MKQRKSLELNSKVSLEALVSDEKTELNFRVGKKEYRISGEEIQELSNWLISEVIQRTPAEELAIISQYKAQISGVSPILNGPTASGPSQIASEAKGGDLEARRAVVSAGGIVDLSHTQGIIKPTDDLRIQNLSSQIGKAKEAFSPENLNKPTAI